MVCQWIIHGVSMYLKIARAASMPYYPQSKRGVKHTVLFVVEFLISGKKNFILMMS